MVARVSRRRRTIRTGDVLFHTVNNVLLVFALLIVLYPLLYIISSSMSTASAIMAGKIWLWPVSVDLTSYRIVLTYPGIWRSYLNTTIYAVGGTSLNLVLTIMIAYPLSRKDFKARGPVMGLLVFTMIFNGGIIPTYILIGKLGLLNTMWAMIIPTSFSAWNVIITRTFYVHNIPEELIFASKIDGCSDFRFVLKILLPLSGAITAVNILFYAVGHWNVYFTGLLYLNKQQLYSLQLFLRKILVLNQISEEQVRTAAAASQGLQVAEQLKHTLKYALIIVATLPVMCIYPFVQKHFVKGVRVGALKG